MASFSFYALLKFEQVINFKFQKTPTLFCGGIPEAFNFYQIWSGRTKMNVKCLPLSTKISFGVRERKAFLVLASIITPGVRFNNVLTDIGNGSAYRNNGINHTNKV